MTQEKKDSLHEWLKANFVLLTSRNIDTIVSYIEQHYAAESAKTDFFYDDENPDQIKQSIEEI